MIRHNETDNKHIRNQIRNHVILFAGNSQLKIYGMLNCASGKRMKKENRIFFVSAKEAIKHGFRPGGHCMKNEYKNWKNDSI